MAGVHFITFFRDVKILSFILLMTMVCLSSCFPEQRQPVPIEPPRVKVQTRDYPGITPNQVLAASEKIFQLADEGDVTIRRKPSILVVKRPHKSLVYKSLEEKWTVETRREEGATYVKVSALFEKEGSEVYPRGIGTYRLFFSRLDYLLGASSNWMTCLQYEAKIIRDPSWGHEDRFLCMNAKDKVPEGPLDLRDG